MIARALTEHETTTVQQGLEHLSHYSADGEVRHTARLLTGLFSQPDRIRFRTAGSEEFDPAPRTPPGAPTPEGTDDAGRIGRPGRGAAEAP